MADTGERSGGKHCLFSDARGLGKERGDNGGEGRKSHIGDDNDESRKGPGGKVGGGETDSSKGDNLKCKRCSEAEHKSMSCQIMSAAYMVERGARRRYARTSSLFLRPRTAGAVRIMAFITDTPGELCKESADKGVVVRTHVKRGSHSYLWKWGIVPHS